MGPGENHFGALISKCLERRECLLEQSAGLRLEGWHRGSRLDAADDVSPLQIWIVEVRCAYHLIHRIHGKEVPGGIRIDAVSVESLGRNTDDCRRSGIDVELATHNARIASVVLHPG